MRILLSFFLISAFTVNAQHLDFGDLENLKIRSIGPANMSGRITAIDAVVSNPKIIFVVAASGGVWKSENGGSAWTPVFDEQPTQNIGALAIQQSDPKVIWVGTGEGNPRNSMNLGMGIFKSNDGGKTWQHLGLEATKTIHRIWIDPLDDQTVFVGASGDPFTPNEDRGLYKTSDGGQHWEKVLYTNSTSGIGDFVVDPNNANRMFAAMYDHRRTPFSFVSGGPGSGLYYSGDRGLSWKKLDSSSGLPEGELGRIGLAIAPSNSNRMYAKIEAQKNLLYRSEDGGQTWVVINDNPKFTNNRPFYFQDLAVDSENPDRLYNIYQPLSVSYDGGKNFDPKPMIPADETKGIHADFHAMWINPKDAQHFIIGGDGGLGITYDHGASWYFPENIPVAQFYHINVDYDTPFNVYGGMQDNGNWSGPAYTWKRGGIRTLYWQYLVGGDGFYISPDKDNSRFGFGTSQNGDLYRYDKVSGYYQSIAPQSTEIDAPLRFNWNAGFAKDPHDDHTVYYGSQYVHQSVDNGANWTIISPDLSTNNPEHQKGDYGGLTLDISGAENYNSILTIATSHLNRDILWVGTDDGQVQLTRDSGKTWTNLTAKVKGLPEGSWIARIHASRYDEQTAWLVVNNYRQGDYAPYLFRTDDFGETWFRVVDDMDVKGYALSFVQDPVEPNLLFLGTENGLWMSANQGDDWTQVKNGFPSVSTMDLVIQEKESALVIGTFGRAIWVMDDLTSLRYLMANKSTQSITALPVNEVVQVKGLFIAPPGNIWTGFHTTFEGENRVFQKAELPVFLATEPQENDSITVTIEDANGQFVNTASGTGLKRGLNYLIWNLDEKPTYLPGSWVHEESRGIPVLPGVYTLKFQYRGQTSLSTVEIVADPRFEIEKTVDLELYRYQKAVNDQVVKLSYLLGKTEAWNKAIKEKQDALEQRRASNEKSKTVLKNLQSQLTALNLLALDKPVDRQVGAWQSSRITAYSAVEQALKASSSRMTVPSVQDWKRVDLAEQLFKEFEKAVTQFERQEWVKFKK
ncbi:MAG: hypothetical protein NWS37_08525 [Flavobacteriaceae bacterium]|jgi:photosystem II stability/assembly factor-like uncharacterized protein|nr:hypothetical protein [Flavobacteriaceae bacterium]